MHPTRVDDPQIAPITNVTYQCLPPVDTATSQVSHTSVRHKFCNQHTLRPRRCHDKTWPCPWQRSTPAPPPTTLPIGADTPQPHRCGQRQHWPTVQHQRHGVKVHCPPPCSWGTRPPLLITHEQGKCQCHAQGCHSNRALRSGHNPPMATATTRHRYDDCNQRPPAASPPSCISYQNSEAIRRQGPKQQCMQCDDSLKMTIFLR